MAGHFPGLGLDWVTVIFHPCKFFHVFISHILFSTALARLRSDCQVWNLFNNRAPPLPSLPLLFSFSCTCYSFAHTYMIVTICTCTQFNTRTHTCSCTTATHTPLHWVYVWSIYTVQNLRLSNVPSYICIHAFWIDYVVSLFGILIFITSLHILYCSFEVGCYVIVSNWLSQSSTLSAAKLPFCSWILLSQFWACSSRKMANPVFQ